MEFIKVENLYKSYGALQVLKDINVTVLQGDVVALIGPSGGGKSTFLRCLNRLETADSGSICVKGDYLLKDGVYASDADAKRILSRMGMCFQQFNLFPHMTVLQNLLEAPMIVKGLKKDEVEPLAMELLKKVGLSSKADAYPSQLSGGQQQRVAIARALTMKPEIMLFDEPTSSLDPELTGEVLRTMRGLAEEKITMLVATHEMGFAREAANRLLFLSGGTVLESGDPKEVFDAPKTERLKAFLSSVLK